MITGRPVPALPSWLTEPLWDQSAALLPQRSVYDRPTRWAATARGSATGSCSTSCSSSCASAAPTRRSPTQMVRKGGVDAALSAALAPWCKPRAVHDPGKILLDLALAVALGGDCLADVAMLRAEPALFGPVASDPTVSRLVDTLPAAGSRALAAIRTARAEVRDRIWRLAGPDAPNAVGQVIVDIDGVLVLAHSDKEDATRTGKKTYGHHPLMAFVDHGRGGSGESVAGLLRQGRAGSNTAADHIQTTRLALAQLPGKFRRGRHTLIRTDSAGGTHKFLGWLTARGRWLSYSVGMTITEQIHQAVLRVPASAWTPAFEPSGEIRDGAWVAELAGDVLDGCAGHAADRPQGTPASRCPVAFHGRRRHAPDGVRHQHQGRHDRRAGTAPPPAGPRRGPSPHRPLNRPYRPASTTPRRTSLRAAPPRPEPWNPAPTRRDSRAINLPTG